MKRFSKLILVSFLAILFSGNANALSTTKKVVGVAALGAAALIVYTNCNTANAYVLDLPEEKRHMNVCMEIFERIEDNAAADAYMLRNSEATLNAKILRSNLNKIAVSSGEPPDPDNCDAHHIVPGTENRKWAKEYAQGSRDILASCRIDINSDENGVYLPSKKDGTSNCQGSYHKSVHNKNYYSTIYNILIENKNAGGCDGVRDALKMIKESLIKGQL